MTETERAAELHSNGVHMLCRPAKGRVVGGTGSSHSCAYAGKVERWHSHDHDGPLECGCDEFGAD